MNTAAGNIAVSSNASQTLVSVLETTLERHGVLAAIQLCKDRIDADPNDVDAHRHIAHLHACSGQRHLAIQAATRASEIAPTDPKTWSDLGRVHVLSDQLESAVDCFARSISIDATYADGWHNLGVALHRLDRLQPALTALRNALLIEPTRANTYLALGNLLVTANQLEDAVECFERATRHDPSLARARSRLAEQLSQRGKVKRAERLFRQSLGLDPNHIDGWLGLARTLEDIGERDGAVDAYMNVLRLWPDHPLALGQYLSLARSEDSAKWIDAGEAALRNSELPDEGRALIGYGIAKYHDRRGAYAMAAKAGTLANSARRRASGPLDRQSVIERVDGIIKTYTSDFFAARRPYGLGADQPVFIVGMPRSGTTLIEQIISAHPHAHGAGELPTLAKLAAGCVDEDQSPWCAAAQLDKSKSRMIAGLYLDGLRDGSPQGRSRISDKSPLNLFHLALVALMFPRARVLHCRRSIRDIALSIWLENFNSEQRYATDFDDLAFFIDQYERLMEHWREVLPLRMIDIQYEQTVEHLEDQTRRVIKFLDLPWDARCLDFHLHSRAVQTPSRWQVRRPIYKDSLGRWQNYAEHLPAMMQAFDNSGMR